jgi:hypothetical protein
MLFWSYHQDKFLPYFLRFVFFLDLDLDLDLDRDRDDAFLVDFGFRLGLRVTLKLHRGPHTGFINLRVISVS